MRKILFQLIIKCMIVSGLEITNVNVNKNRSDLARRSFIQQRIISHMTLAFVVTSDIDNPFRKSYAEAAETVGKDPNCNDASCLGVWDGLLADCPHNNANSVIKWGSGCASSQDDTPGFFSEPWDYSESIPLDGSSGKGEGYEDRMRVLVPAIEMVCAKRGDTVEILMKTGRYLRVRFTDSNSREESIGEFYFTPNDTTVQFRVGSTNPNHSSPFTKSLPNIERTELIRKQLRYEKLPVLRNRKRALFFAESDFDTFGPGSASLGPPAEMKTGELEGRGSDDVDPKLRIDILQQFPTTSSGNQRLR